MSREEDHAQAHPARFPEDDLWVAGPNFIASNQPLARLLGRPVAEFLRVQAAGGVLLFAAAVIAMVWANSPWAETYEALWSTPITVTSGTFEMSADLRHWINDGLMVIFFFVIGMEIKYELVSGHLRDPRAAAVPVIAALGGMIGPALIYFLIVGTGEGSSGWAIPMATDIAFVVGVLALFGRRIPAPARVFLLTLAVADDIGAIAVIAVFYTTSLSLSWLGMAAATFLTIVVLRRMRVWSIPLYVVLGIFAWFATYQSGVHATIAGVALGLLTPARPLVQDVRLRSYGRHMLEHDMYTLEDLERLRFLVRESVPLVARLQFVLHPFSAYIVLPIFALANAGVALEGGVLGVALGSPITLGVATGLLAGKVTGITVATWVAVKTGLGRLPTGATWPMTAGLGMLGGIGFTVALFITGLSFPGAEHLTDQAKVGVLGGSLLAALIGSAYLMLVTRSEGSHDAGGAS